MNNTETCGEDYSVESEDLFKEGIDDVVYEG